jgi:hypothetical protein
MALHIVMCYYTVVVVQTVAHCCTMVVVETVARDYTVVVACCYTATAVQVVLLCVQPTPYMYLKSSLSSSPKLYSPSLHVQQTCKNYKMYSSTLFDTSALGGNDRDHAHVFYKSHTMVLLKIKGLAYPLQYTAQIMDTHSYDGLLYCTLYTKRVPFSPYLYSDSTKMLSSPGLASTLPQLDMFAYTDFPLIIRLFAEPHPDSEIYVASKDTSNVATTN